MAGHTIGGFWIKRYEFTKSWGVEPASASGVGVVGPGAEGPPIAVGSYVAYSFFGISFYGLVASLEKLRSFSDGDEWAFQVVDNRIRLRWAVVFGQWNMEEDEVRVHADPVPTFNSQLDEWWGGQVGFDQGVDFTGGIESEMGMPRPLVSAGSAGRGRMYRHIHPSQWAAQFPVLTKEPKTAAEIIREACRGAKGGGDYSFNFHSIQLSKPVMGIDANAGMSLAALIQQLADAQGLMVTMEGVKTLRFERRGSGVAVVPPGAYVERDGNSISSEPTKVRLVGGRRLVQVNEVPLLPDWKVGWEKYVSEPAWLAAVEAYLVAQGAEDMPGGPGEPSYHAEVAARAREITLRDWVDGMDENANASEYIDNGRWGSVCRMDMPVWAYLNQIVYRSYRIPEEFGLYGLPIEQFELHDRLLAGVKLKKQGEDARTIYSDPPDFYPEAPGFVAAKGPPVDLLASAESGAVVPLPRLGESLKEWVTLGDFSLDVASKRIRFTYPVFRDGGILSGRGLLCYPNRGQGGGTDISGQTEDESYLNIVAPNPHYEISTPEVRAALVFKLGMFSKDFGSGVRWTSHHAPAIAEHLLHGADGVALAGTKQHEGAVGVPEPPPEGFMEILCDNGMTAVEMAEEASEGLTFRNGVEASGSFRRVGAAGVGLNGAIDRVTVTVDQENGVVEVVDFAKPRMRRGFVPSRELAERVRNEEMWTGQRDLQREVRQLRAISRLSTGHSPVEKQTSATHQTLPDLLRKPLGVGDEDARTLPDPNSQHPEGQDSWQAGDLVWLDENGLPSRKGVNFGGVVVASSKVGGQPVKYVSVALVGRVPVKVECGIEPGEVRANRGAKNCSKDGVWPIGMLAHSTKVPGPEGEIAVAIVELGHPGRREGRFTVYFDQPSQRLYVSEGAYGVMDFDDPGKVVPVYPKLGGKVLSEARYWEAGGISAGKLYEVILDLRKSEVVLRQAGGITGEEEESLRLAEMKFKSGDGGLVLDGEITQLWESDCLWPLAKSESISGSEFDDHGSSSGVGGGNGSSADRGGSSGSRSGSHGSDSASASSMGSSGSSGRDSGGRAASSGSIGDLHSSSSFEQSNPGGSDKSTAIVPAWWMESGYTAMFIHEMPDVRFSDVVEIPIRAHFTRVPVDFRFMSVCEPGTVVVVSAVGDRGVVRCARVEGQDVVVESDPVSMPCKAVVTLSGVRKGFAGKRFPARTRKQFVENEEWINKAYSK